MTIFDNRRTKHRKRLALLLILAILCTLFLSACDSKLSYVGDEEAFFTASVDYKDDFKILSLSDIHFSYIDNLEKHCAVLKKTIEKAQPDLIVMNGDLFTYARKSTVKYLFDFIDNVGGDKPIPWTFTYGNHDDQGEFDMYYLIEAASEYSNARVTDNRNYNVSGRTNYIINLVQGDDIKHQVFLIDSHGHIMHGPSTYQAIQEDQVEWYEHMVKYTENKTGHKVYSSMFFHIPTLEIRNWIENEAFDPGTEQYGDLLEGVCSPEIDYGLASKVLELGSTKSVVYGHDHVNDFIFTHEGVQFAYGFTATNRIYWTEEKLGGLVLTIKSDGSSVMEQIKVEY